MWFEISPIIAHPYYECHKVTSHTRSPVPQPNHCTLNNWIWMLHAILPTMPGGCHCQSQRLSSRVYTRETYSGIDHDSSDIIGQWHPVIRETLFLWLSDIISGIQSSRTIGECHGASDVISVTRENFNKKKQGKFKKVFLTFILIS